MTNEQLLEKAQRLAENVTEQLTTADALENVDRTARKALQLLVTLRQLRRLTRITNPSESRSLPTAPQWLVAPTARIAAAISLDQTCGACPEQYEATYNGKPAGYLRLRHGCFMVRYPDSSGALVYDATPRGDGLFEDDERDYYLEQARIAIAKEIRKEEPVYQKLILGEC